jgi:hypothetical protein
LDFWSVHIVDKNWQTVVKQILDKTAGQCFSPVSPTNKTDHYECATDGRICLECDLVLTLNEQLFILSQREQVKLQWNDAENEV